MDANGPGGARPSEAVYAAEMASIRKDIVNFHGEMVLLLNYSSINYTGTTPPPPPPKLATLFQQFH